ncbi:alanine dehydrogenase [Candidatus Peregrinibacteria bacterium]|jgi:alanine dehydrogenase|nr:alanine dehydrogenase [Candidatus Peregrinibacteria bacterium]MBT4631690.1 alanine dehydrogenase [Candidatus Peregrinibacteria bacterium]MBT5517219.1 alanine dehydrogenase [Candidatus Peregrinibacteria bacterium]MBT5824247.1 alanine dehydrogenase [Candidatus Peregrinibacteria bacterium]
MIIATLKEVKDNENRVGLTPYGVRELVEEGHTVIVQETAGIGSGFSDTEYKECGAQMMRNPEDIVKEAEIIVKVKEPVPSEYNLLEQFAGKTLFTYLHLSGVDKRLTKVLVNNNITAIAYETLEDEQGQLPLLAPMSEVAGVVAIQYGAEYLQKKYNGRGVTLGVISGTDSARVVVVGGGFVGATSAKTAAGMGCRVKLFDINPARVEELNAEMAEYLGPNLSKNFEAIVPDGENYDLALQEANLVVGAVLVAGAKAPEIISEEQVKSMKDGTVIVDVSIDQGGCIWGSRGTTHSEPTYEIYGKIFCCVTNMPGQYSRQSTMALTSATLPYLKMIAKEGAHEVMKRSLAGNGRMARGLNTYKGHLTYERVAQDLGMTDSYKAVEELV